MLNTHANLLDERGTLVLPDDVTYIKSEEFERMRHLKRLVGKNVEAVFADGVAHCDNLISVDFPNCVFVDDRAFLDCDNLYDFTFGNKLKYIGVDAFDGCSFENVTITTDNLELGYGAFANCHSLKKIVLNCHMPAFTLNSFYGCRSLTEIDLAGDVDHVEIAGTFYLKLSHLKVPSSVKKITTDVGCNSTDFDIEIPDDVVLDYDSAPYLYSFTKWFFAQLDKNDVVKVNTDRGEVTLYDKSDKRFENKDISCYWKFTEFAKLARNYDD